MCCNLRTHVIVLSIVHLSLTFVTGLYFGLSLRRSQDWAIGLHILAHVVLLVSGILCLIGAFKNNKCLLIPSIVVEGLKILACIGGFGFFVFEGHVSLKHGDRAGFGLLIFGPPLMIELGLTIYFLTIGIKFYQELSSRVVGGRTEGFVLQPYLRFRQEEEVSTVYVQPVTQNLMCANQQQPPSYAETQQEKAQQNDLNMKNPA